MIAVETRTSAPVRVTRDGNTLQHITVEGLFPCGEGAGYAGGIVSAGIDGERCAEAVAAIWKLVLRHDQICCQTNKNPHKNKKVSERKS